MIVLVCVVIRGGIEEEEKLKHEALLSLRSAAHTSQVNRVGREATTILRSCPWAVIFWCLMSGCKHVLFPDTAISAPNLWPTRKPESKYCDTETYDDSDRRTNRKRRTRQLLSTRSKRSLSYVRGRRTENVRKNT
jgi:hypothetical protein